MNKIPSRPPSPIAKPPSLNIIVPAFEKPTFGGERSDSIIHPDFHGFNLITGFRGKGKSTLAMSWDNPNNIIMLDYEGKEKESAEKLGITYFDPMKDVIGKLGTSFDAEHVYNRTLQIVDAIPENRFTVLVIDNAHEFQDSCSRKIEKSPELVSRFGLKQKNVDSGAYGGALPGAKRLIAYLIHLISSKGIKVVSTTFQLKPAWANNQPAFGKWTTTNVSIWHEESKLTVAMEDPLPKHLPIPRAIVMKENLPLRKWDPDLKQTVTIRRIPPVLPRATAFDIYNYLDNPVDMRNLKDDERVEALDIAPYTPTFSKEQVTWYEKISRLQSQLGVNGEGGE